MKSVNKETLVNFINELQKLDMLNPEIVYNKLTPDTNKEKTTEIISKNIKTYYDFADDFLLMEFENNERIIDAEKEIL
jgi:uncharacterized protein YfkK (UPF0435 family)